MQDLFSEFGNKIAYTLEREIEHNRDLIEKYLRHPRPHTQFKDSLKYIKLYQSKEKFMTWEERNKHRKIVPRMADFKVLLSGNKKEDGINAS